MANVLRNRNGVKKGDRVTIYLPMIPEAAYAMLACARIGAVHSSGLRRLLAGLAGAAASLTASRRSSSPPMKACAAARRCR
jgi:acyl-CoA synthetase (AMP-forming)/AMP-acid ligase II